MSSSATELAESPIRIVFVEELEPGVPKPKRNENPRAPVSGYFENFISIFGSPGEGVFQPDSPRDCLFRIASYLDDLEKRYGGIDAVLIWPTYPNMGIAKPREGVDPDDDIMIDILILRRRRYKKGEPLMNGDRARQQLERIEAMVKESRSNCTIELEPTSAVDSVYLTFHCGAQMHRVQWVGAWLESLTPTALWHELDIATRGAIKKPTT